MTEQNGVGRSSELLPCPFCGGGCVVQNDVVRGGKTMWHVYHFCKGPVGHHGHYGHADTTEIQTAYFDMRGQAIAAWNQAIAAWNRRADHDRD